MKCPFCGSLKTYVSGTTHVGCTVRRYRKCSDCNRTFTTTESLEAPKKGRPRKMNCKWCGREIKSWYLTYNGMPFCRYNNDQCLKNYLFEEHDKEIAEDRNGDSEYSMREVCENDGLQDNSV